MKKHIFSLVNGSIKDIIFVLNAETEFKSKDRNHQKSCLYDEKLYFLKIQVALSYKFNQKNPFTIKYLKNC